MMMMMHRLTRIAIIIYTTVYSSYAAASANINNNPDVKECSLWIAPSTIPGAGLGLFAGKFFAIHETVTPGDLTVPLLDMHWHNNVDSFDYDHLFVWDEYTWADHSFARMGQESDEVYGASFGIGALPNCLFSVLKIEESNSRFDTAGLSRRNDPGVGAFTPYHDRFSFATDDIPAGQEVFVDYGHDYFLQDTRLQSIGIIPFEYSFDYADELLHAFVDYLFVTKPQQSVAVMEDLYEFVRTNVSNIWQSRTLKALPELPKHLEFTVAFEHLATYGTASVHEERSTRSLETLREQGTCAGNLEIRPSAVKQAGRGAFAVQAIPAGHVVAAAPLLHIPDRSVLKMHDVRSSTAGDPVVHQQLLLNYCFGHKDSTLLLCPYGVTTGAINHAAKPNVRIEWSSKLTVRPEWKDMPVEEWAYQYRAGLAFEYIAIRDISAGEEIFLDYGPSWVAAWKQHVRQWTPKGRHFYSEETEAELNQDFDSVLPTVAEEAHSLRTRHHVEVLCREEYRQMRGLPPSTDKDNHRCRIRQRTEDLRYVAEILSWTENRKMETCCIRVKEVLFDLPRDAFRFRDLPYTRDHAQYWSFRHEMEVPEYLFPPVWKNRL